MLGLLFPGDEAVKSLIHKDAEAIMVPITESCMNWPMSNGETVLLDFREMPKETRDFLFKCLLASSLANSPEQFRDMWRKNFDALGFDKKGKEAIIWEVLEDLEKCVKPIDDDMENRIPY